MIAINHEPDNIDASSALNGVVTFPVMENVNEKLVDLDDQGRVIWLELGCASAMKSSSTSDVPVVEMPGPNGTHVRVTDRKPLREFLDKATSPQNVKKKLFPPKPESM